MKKKRGKQIFLQRDDKMSKIIFRSSFQCRNRPISWKGTQSNSWNYIWKQPTVKHRAIKCVRTERKQKQNHIRTLHIIQMTLNKVAICIIFEHKKQWKLVILNVLQFSNDLVIIICDYLRRSRNFTTFTHLQATAESHKPINHPNTTTFFLTRHHHFKSKNHTMAQLYSQMEREMVRWNGKMKSRQPTQPHENWWASFSAIFYFKLLFFLMFSYNFLISPRNENKNHFNEWTQADSLMNSLVQCFFFF